MSDTLVLIPNYNHGPYLRESITSALDQTYECDVLVVDDGSTDRSIDIISEFGDAISFICKENKGPGHTRNVGINWALEKGYKYIQLLDADDKMMVSKVAILKEILDRYPEVGIVYDDYYHLYSSPLFGEINAIEYKRSATPETLWTNNLIHCNSLVKTEVFTECQLGPQVYFDEQMRVAQDYDFWLRATQKYIAWHHPEALSFVREGVNNSAGKIHGEIREDCMNKLRQRNIGEYKI